MLDPDISTRDALRLLQVAETDPHALDRRRFLQLVGMGLGAGIVAGAEGSLLDSVLGGPSAWAAGPVGPNDGILVVLGMFGGNDGLNTVVPHGDGLYYTQHGGLAIPANETLSVGTGTGLNPRLTDLKRFWDLGQLAIVEGIGYPNADFSHFNSMAYWMSGQPGSIPTSGWLGRWLDGYLGSGKDLFAAAEVGSSVPLHLVGHQQRGTAVPAAKPSFGVGTSDQDKRNYTAIRAMRTSANGPWHGAVAQAFVDQLDLAATLAPLIPETLPTPNIVARMEVAARLINANLGFRVLTAGWGDFDSHAGQPDMHGARMTDLNAAIKRFFEVLAPAWASRVVVMTFSEFGRTSWNNDGAGTDHGSAAPQFVIGANVKGGIYGQRPSLAGIPRWGRMGYHVDLRSYYASMIDGWLGGGSSAVLGGTFENLGLFARGPGQNPPAPPSGGTPPISVQSPAAGFVPVTPFRLVDTRDGTGGVLNRALSATEHVSVRVCGVGPVPNDARAVVANVTAVWPTEAMYFTVYPGSSSRPDTSNLNAMPGRPVPNLVVMGVGDDGCVEVYNSHGSTHCVVDVFGYFSGTAGDRFVPVSPSRLFDTRDGTGVRPGKLVPSTPVEIQVAGLAGVPPTGATAVVMNLTATQPEAPGWLRLAPTGVTPELTSNVNFDPWDTVPNLAICKLGDGGRVCLDSPVSTHALGDVFGYFTGSGERLRPMAPARLLDTRLGVGAPVGRVGPGAALQLVVRGQHGIPAGATAVVLNVTATNVGGASHVAVWPDGEAAPPTSNLNVFPGQTIANLVICRIGAGGALSMASPHAHCDLIADALGYFLA